MVTEEAEQQEGKP